MDTTLALHGGLALWALLVALLAVVALAPSAPRRLSAHQAESRRAGAKLRRELEAAGLLAPRSSRWGR